MGIRKNPSPTLSPDERFSANEIPTGARWIDGKQIYRKVIDIGALPNNATKSVNHGIVGLGQVVRLWGIAVNATPTYRTLPYVTNTANSNVALECNTVAVGVITAADWSTHTGRVVIEYVKA